MKKIYLLIPATVLFTFSLLAQQQPPFTFVHISDLHVSTVPSEVNLCDINGVEAQCYLHDFANMNPKPAFVIASGDISNIGNSTAVPGGMYSALTQYLYPQGLTYPGIGTLFIDSAQTIPIYFAPGNHEYYTTLTGISIQTQTLPLLPDSIPNYVKNIGPDTDYAVTTDISVILFMRSGWDISYLVSTDPKGSGFNDEQISWMRSQLAANSNKRKMLVMHHPPSNYEGTACSNAPHNTVTDSATASFTVNRTEFLNICDSFNVDVVLCGHTHANVVTDRAGNQIEENCTTCGTRYVQTGPAFTGCYRTVTVDSSFITVSQPQQTCFATALQDVTDELNLSIYPNPSIGIFSLNIGQNLQFQVKVYNLLGQCVYTQNATGPDFKVDLNAQSNGLYFLQLITAQSTPVTYNIKSPLVISK